MSTYLTAQSLTLSYTSSALFRNLTFTIHRGDKVGLIGHNGCGKSSLLKLLSGQFEPTTGQLAKANHCLMSYVEQHIPSHVQSQTVLEALSETLPDDEQWRAELLLAELGFSDSEWSMPVVHCSGGQQMRLLLARAIINQPDLLLLDEPSNHLDLPSLLWLEQFLLEWKGSFVLVSHDQTLLDAVTNTTWIMRDQSLYHFSMPCSQARYALTEKDAQDKHRHQIEQKEINRIEKSAKRLATWGKIYDNEDLARKAKTMIARKERLEEEQTLLTEGTPWQLKLQGDALAANRLVEIRPYTVAPPRSEFALFDMPEMRVKSGDRIAVLGGNGCGKSTLLNHLYQVYMDGCIETFNNSHPMITFHDRCRLGYYDQSLAQLSDQDTLKEALINYAVISDDQSKRALISAGFEYARHDQLIASLSGGERARLLFVGLTLARYHLLFLDEPTNHLDMEGKEELIDTLNQFQGASVLVSHDRTLVEQSCNRFWLIKDGALVEYLTANEIYQQMTELPLQETVESKRVELGSLNSTSSDQYEEEQILERLIELEQLLSDDLQRKPKHQKPHMQQQWQSEIEQLNGCL